ncbi:MAG: RNA-directed DNA polymerase, partial [Richelia sp. SM1_7_0]|nr:RNA-directed DNA polymerase [Richelia sp. SM1_7_0]
MLFDINHIDGNYKTPYTLFKKHFQIQSLKEIHNQKFQSTKTKGLDRISGRQFSRQAVPQIRVIKKKCLNGTYKFSPYLELLSTKGRDKLPRVLSIPTIRDRIVLHALKEMLFDIFPQCKPRRLANTYIHDINKFISEKTPDEVSIFRADIKVFYDSIDRNILFKILKSKIKSRRILTLIKRAIEMPTVPQNYHRKDINKYVNNKGIPQGLSISNVLASIYLYELDNEMEKVDGVNVYSRYVDDILIFTDKEDIDEIEKIFRNKIKSLNLTINEEKSYQTSGDKDFEYLGYRFELPKITVRTSTIEKYIHSIAAKFSNYIHNREKKLSTLKKRNRGLKPNQLVEKLKEIFIEELNEKITGAINEKENMDWIFYFNTINDK